MLPYRTNQISTARHTVVLNTVASQNVTLVSPLYQTVL